jgi:CRISPR/Cas system-associated endonuclease Cas1
MATLYLTEQRAVVKRDNDCLVVHIPPSEEGGEGRRVTIPLMKVDQVVVIGNVTVTTPALLALLEQEVEVCWLSYFGHFRGRLHPAHSKNAPLRLAQHRAHCDQSMRAEIARQIVIGKLKNMRAVLLRYARSREDREIAIRAEEIGNYIATAASLRLQPGPAEDMSRAGTMRRVRLPRVVRIRRAHLLSTQDDEMEGMDNVGAGVVLSNYALDVRDWPGRGIEGFGVDAEAEAHAGAGTPYDGGAGQPTSEDNKRAIQGDMAGLGEYGYELDLALSSDGRSGTGGGGGGGLSGEMSAVAVAGNRMHGLGVLLGLEGAGSSAYFSVFNRLLKPPWDEMFPRRVRRPPTDPVNALLSFGYTLLCTQAMAMGSVVGFDPYMGYLHAAGYGKPALALDLMEEFRPVVVDSVVITLLNTGVLKPGDFVLEGLAGRSGEESGGPIARVGAVRLTDAGRKVFLTRFEERMRDMIKHPVFGYQVTYRRCLEMQARLLAKTVTGEIPGYVPFVVR